MILKMNNYKNYTRVITFNYSAMIKIIESKCGNKILLVNNFNFFIGSVNTNNGNNILW